MLSASRTGSRSRRGAQDQRGLQLPGRGVEAGVQDAGVGAARAVGEGVVSLEEGGVDAAVGEGVEHGGTDDAAADDGDRCVGHEFSFKWGGKGRILSGLVRWRLRRRSSGRGSHRLGRTTSAA